MEEEEEEVGKVRWERRRDVRVRGYRGNEWKEGYLFGTEIDPCYCFRWLRNSISRETKPRLNDNNIYHHLLVTEWIFAHRTQSQWYYTSLFTIMVANEKNRKNRQNRNLTKTWIYAIELRLKFSRKYCHIQQTFSQTFWHDRTREY